MGAQGTATVDCGAFPGIVDRVAVAVATTGVVSTSEIEAWIFPEAAGTVDHSVDEHMLENIKAFGTFFSNDVILVWIVNDNRLIDPSTGIIPRVYGTWNVGWVWN
jgi:hypothetical protein